MKTGERDIHSNGLNICIDWLSWTLSEPCTVEFALQLMGYSIADFQLLLRAVMDTVHSFIIQFIRFLYSMTAGKVWESMWMFLVPQFRI